MVHSFVTCSKPVHGGNAPTRSRSRRRRAIAATEFALVAPFLAALVIGMCEMGRGVMVKDILTNAARIGSRDGATYAGTYQKILDDVNDVLTANNLTYANATVTVQIASYTGTSTTPSWGPFTTVTSGSGFTPKPLDKVLVQVSMNVKDVLWFSPVFMSSTALESESVTMLRQG